MGWLVSPSSVADPPGPERVMLARSPSQPSRPGTTKTNDDSPPPSAVAGISKLIEKSV